MAARRICAIFYLRTAKNAPYFGLPTFTAALYQLPMPPTSFQRKMLWAAITALSMVAIAAVIVLVGKIVVDGMAYLRPVLLPLAIAGILAYLLEPAVRWLEGRNLSRLWSVIVVFLVILAVSAGILIWILPTVWHQGQSFAANLPSYSQRAQDLFTKTFAEAQRLAELPLFKKAGDPAAAANDPVSAYLSKVAADGITTLQAKVPDMAAATGRFLQRSAGSAFGAFGVMLSLILVPLFLFFFLNDSKSISSNWSNYLPLRASPLKNEIVSLISEINGYLISFFRGQLMVSIVDGILIGFSLLVFIQLDFALLIGLLVCVLGLIPYAGMLICWIPAVLIATAQYGDWWHPFWVTVIFLVCNQLEWIFLSPKIVGDSVGLHPLTVIISVLAWSVILGGLLGALLAVPLTATLKVLLKRYFWDRPAVE
jgi:predicted PurR-regulated permease PerM